MKREADPGRARRAGTETGHDRLVVLRTGSRTLIAIADRVRCISPASRDTQAAVDAADRTIEELTRCFERGVIPDDARDWEMILQGIDQTLLREPRCTQASALVMLVSEGQITGASAGSISASMLQADGTRIALFASSAMGPGIGSGIATPLGFGPVPLRGRLVTEPAHELREARAPSLGPLYQASA